MTLPEEIIIGVGTSLIAAIIYATAGGGYRRWFGQRIAITDPAEHGFLPPPESRAGVMAHTVHGTVRHIPKGHRIWLVVVNEATSQYWPQSFAPVETDEAKGTWKGYVNAFGWQQKWQNITIMALIAPPTTQEFFKYFQRVGNKTGFEPLSSIPPECKWSATVQAKVPAQPA